MKAWRMYGINDIRLDDIPVPEVIPGWVLIKVIMLQPSVTEVQQLMGSGGGGEELEQLIKEKGPQQKFGHEFCGEVVELGEGVSDIKVGDRVFCWRRVPCKRCALCQAGFEDLCCQGPLVGSHIPGCLAEYIALPAESVAVVPDSISDAEVTALQPLMGVTSSVADTGIEMGDNVVVLGQGSMGFNVTQVSAICGAGKTIAIDVRDDLLKLASHFGADVTINANKTDPVKAVFEATSGVGADVVFECAGGSPQHGLSGTKTLNQAFEMVRDGGKITQVGILGAGAAVEVTPISMRGLQYRGIGHCTLRVLRYTIDAVAAKRIQIEPTITHTLEGLEKVPEAFEITGNKTKYGAINPAQVIINH